MDEVLKDYEILIANLRGERDEPPSEYCKDAANAIEALIAERDHHIAVVNQLLNSMLTKELTKERLDKLLLLGREDV